MRISFRHSLEPVDQHVGFQMTTALVRELETFFGKEISFMT